MLTEYFLHPEDSCWNHLNCDSGLELPKLLDEHSQETWRQDGLRLTVKVSWALECFNGMFWCNWLVWRYIQLLSLFLSGMLSLARNGEFHTCAAWMVLAVKHNYSSTVANKAENQSPFCSPWHSKFENWSKNERWDFVLLIWQCLDTFVWKHVDPSASFQCLLGLDNAKDGRVRCRCAQISFSSHY